MRIGFDIDGVLADFNTSFIALIKKVTGKNLFPNGYWPTTWNYPESLGYTAVEVGWAWDAIKAEGNFWRDLGALPDTAALQDWLWNGNAHNDVYDEFYFITSRMGKNVKRQTEDWLEEHLELPGLTVLISSEKGALAKALKLDYYVDDRAENILDVNEKSPTTFAFLIDQPWNRHKQVNLRINELSTFLESIDRYAVRHPTAA